MVRSGTLRKVLITIVIGFYVQIGYCSQCIIASDHKIRTFKNLHDYRQNAIGFDVKMGNIVRFEVIDKDVLYANIFQTKDSGHITEMDLQSRNIAKIEDNAFVDLHCLLVLDLSNNKISNVTEQMFNGIHLLKILNLSNNKLEEIHGAPFLLIGNLRQLDLSENHIKYLSSNSFFELKHLDILDLSYNNLKNVYSETFSNLRNLTKLNLSHNQFERMEVENWKNLESLEILNLSYNRLINFDLEHKFSFVNLKALLLNNNELTTLSIYSLKVAFPNLTIFKIDNNNWNCIDLNYFAMALNNSNIDYAGESHDKEHRNGIACKSIVVPQTTNEPIRFISLPTGTKYEPPTVHPAVLENQSLNGQINSLKFAVTCLSVIVISFVIFEFITRCHVSQRLRRIFGNETHRSYFDDSYSEHIQLARN